MLVEVTNHLSRIARNSDSSPPGWSSWGSLLPTSLLTISSDGETNSRTTGHLNVDSHRTTSLGGMLAP